MGLVDTHSRTLGFTLDAERTAGAGDGAACGRPPGENVDAGAVEGELKRQPQGSARFIGGG